MALSGYEETKVQGYYFKTASKVFELLFPPRCGKVHASGFFRCHLQRAHSGQHHSKGGAMWPDSSCAQPEEAESRMTAAKKLLDASDALLLAGLKPERIVELERIEREMPGALSKFSVAFQAFLGTKPWGEQ